MRFLVKPGGQNEESHRQVILFMEGQKEEVGREIIPWNGEVNLLQMREVDWAIQSFICSGSIERVTDSELRDALEYARKERTERDSPPMERRYACLPCTEVDDMGWHEVVTFCFLDRADHASREAAKLLTSRHSALIRVRPS